MDKENKGIFIKHQISRGAALPIPLAILFNVQGDVF